MFLHGGSTVKVKICGIMDVQIAQAAVDAGADALGFVFAPESSRYIEPETARHIISSLPGSTETVGVFVNNTPREIKEIAEYCGLNIIQLHGDTRDLSGAAFNLPVIKAVRVKNSINTAAELNSIQASALLLDSYHPRMAGGSGETFNWEIVKGLTLKLPLILAGGLHPGNIAKAIQTVKPRAVDVSSGVESGGKKDVLKIDAFTRKAKEVPL